MDARCLLVLVMVVAAMGGQGTAKPQEPESAPHYRQAYHFTRDHFTGNIPEWTELLAPLKGRPGLRYLEIGVDQGRSALWVLENVLTDGTSSMVAVDTFHLEGVEAVFRANLELSGAADRVEVLVGRSQEVLKGLDPTSFDLVYVDGSHIAADVLADAVLSFDLLKPGGMVIFDDYGWKTDLYPGELRPQGAVDAFVAAFQYRLEWVHKGYQAVLKEHDNPCADRYLCTPLDARHLYLWRQGELWDVPGDRKLTLSDAEHAALREALRDHGDNPPLKALASDPRLEGVVDRLVREPPQLQ